MQAWTLLRSDRRRARRRRWRNRSLLDRFYPWYAGALVGGYVALLLSGASQVRIGATRVSGTAAGAAATRCVGELLALLAVTAVGAATAAAVLGGPVVLWPEDARVLLPSPVPRAALLRRGLRLAYGRGLLAAAAAAVLLGVTEVGLLSLPAARALPGAVGVPVLSAATAVGAGWLVQARQAVRVGRAVASVGAVAVLGAVAWTVSALGPHGQLAGWHRLHRLGHLPLLSVLTAAGDPTAGTGRVIAVLVGWALGAAALCVLGGRAAAAVGAEQVVRRAGQGVAVRNALQLGYSSSAYLLRTAPTRQQRTRRRYPPLPGRAGALVAKASLQEQGAPLPARVLLAAVLVTGLDAALFAPAPVRTLAPVLAGGVVSGVLLAAVATRFADPLRIDVELPGPSGLLPTGFFRVAAADLAAPAVTFAAGGLLAAPLVAGLGLRPWSQAPLLAVVGVLLGPAAAAVAALSATGNDPSPLLSPEWKLGVRLRGVLTSVQLTAGEALLLHPLVGRPRLPTTVLDVGSVLGLVTDDVTLTALAVWLGGRALLRAR